MPEFPDGTTIDVRYKIISRLGSGGMADVYLAEDQQLGRRLALKLLHRRFAEDPGFVERFRREAQAAAGLQHPNVVSVYDRGEFEDTYYIAMEYLPGRSLKQLIREEAPLDPLRAIDITTQILKAARFAHRHGVIHRDLKPHNVIVDDSGHAKVTDFGIARAGASDMTETGSIMGTAQYLSPEQAQGHAVSASSDLYSIAVVLYEMLTGRVPFDAESPVTIALKHISETPTMPRRLNAGVPLELEQVVMWALNKSPADRPQEADQLITALEQAKLVIVGEQRGQRTAAMAAVVGVGAHKGAVAAGVIEHPARVQRPADVIVADDHAEESSDEPPPQEDRKRRSPWPWLTVLLVALVAGGAVAAYLLTRPTKLVVPNVVRESLVAASTQLQNDGFAVSTVDVPDSAASGTVIRQTPLPGVKANSGSTVTLTVSAGLGNTTVPGVQDISLGQAKRAIVAQHLKVGNVVGQASDSVPAGEVINTSPGAGQALPVGSPVEIFVSTGRPNVTVPDVTGESQTDARSTLNGQGFTVQTTTETSSSVAAGDVIGESPSPGSSVAPGTTVTLVIAKAAPPKPASATVPNVVGQQPAAAQSALTGAGFKVAQKTKDVVNPAKDGVVVSQTPPANATANQGSTVTIVVGHYKAPTSSTPTTTTPTSATTPTTTSTTP